jgi:hypothetical protein
VRADIAREFVFPGDLHATLMVQGKRFYCRLFHHEPGSYVHRFMV